MKKILDCRRSSLALISMMALFIISVMALVMEKPEVAIAACVPIAGIPVGIGVANAYQGKKNEPKD